MSSHSTERRFTPAQQHWNVWLLVLGVVSAFILGGCDASKRADARVERAKVQLAAGDYRSAMFELKTALEAAPEHRGARVTLARLSLKLGDVESARKQFDRALQSGSGNGELRDLSCEILLAERRFDELVSALSTDKELSAPRRLTLLAAAQTGLQEFNAADQSLAEALRIAPNNPASLLELARLRIAQNRPAEALATVDQTLKSNPELAQGWLLRGRLLMQERNYREAAIAFDRGWQVERGQLTASEELELLAGLADTQLAVRDTKAASETLREMEARFPGSVPAGYLRARLAFLRDDYRNAIAELQRLTQQIPDFVPARLLLGAALLHQGTLEQAEAELSRLVTRQPGNADARKLLAQVYLARQRPAEARRVLSEAVEPGDAQVDWLMGAALLQSGSIDAGISYLEKSVAASGDVELRIKLAAAYLSSGQPEKSRELLEQIPPGARSARSQGLLVLANISGKEPVDAQRALGELVERYHDDATILGVAGAYALTEGDTARARDFLTRSLELDPKGVVARMNVARLEARESNFDAAEMQLRHVLALDPKHQAAFVRLSELAWLKGDRKQAQQWLERGISADPAAVEARLRLAQLAFMEGDATRARSLLEQALSVATERAEVLNAVGEVLMRTGQLDEALTRFEEAAEAGARSAAINAARAQLALGRTNAARRTLESRQAVQFAPVQAAIMLVEIDGREGRTAQALERIVRLRESGLPAFAADELEGDAYAAAKRPEAATRSYVSAFDKRPSRTLALKIYRARNASGASNPEQSLIEWLKNSPGDRTVRLALADHYQRSGSRRAAIDLYEQLTRDTNADPVILNNLAWLYYEEGDRRAVDLARRAHEAAPEVGAIADTYGWVLVEQGRVAEGLAVLEAAAERTGNNMEIRYHLAVASARAGDKERATGLLTALLQSNGEFAYRADAAALLKSLANN